MVTGSEIVFENIYDARDYILEIEAEKLSDLVNKLGEQPLTQMLPEYFNDYDEKKFIMTPLKSGRFSLKPNLKGRRFLFRGETTFHKTCAPNIFRKSNKTDYLDYNVLGDEMRRMILSHPLVQLLDLGIELNGKVYKFEMNLYGLLQHYYHKTSLLDLSCDVNVALFFATQEYAPESDKYNPIIKEDLDPGIIYFYELDYIGDFKSQQSRLSTIGLQVFPRSGRQKGFLYRLEKGENFNDLEQVHAVRFKHNEKIAREISENMNCGKELFPEDALSRYWNTKERNAEIISREALIMNHIDNIDETLESLQSRLLNDYNISVMDYSPSLSIRDLDEYYTNSLSIWKEFCNQILIPFDHNGLLKEELLKVPDNPKYKWAFEKDANKEVNFNDGYLLKKYQEIL